jgi:hypothetical protein
MRSLTKVVPGLVCSLRQFKQRIAVVAEVAKTFLLSVKLKITAINTHSLGQKWTREVVCFCSPE